MQFFAFLNQVRPGGGGPLVGGSLPLDPSKPLGGRPPLDDEHRCLLVEVGVYYVGDVGAETVAVWSFGDRSARDRPA